MLRQINYLWFGDTIWVRLFEKCGVWALINKTTKKILTVRSLAVKQYEGTLPGSTFLVCSVFTCRVTNKNIKNIFKLYRTVGYIHVNLYFKWFIQWFIQTWTGKEYLNRNGFVYFLSACVIMFANVVMIVDILQDGFWAGTLPDPRKARLDISTPSATFFPFGTSDRHIYNTFNIEIADGSHWRQIGIVLSLIFWGIRLRILR